MELHLAMRKLLLAIAFCLVSSAGWAQCTGVFPANTLCGNLSGSPQPPAAFSAGGTVVSPGSTTSGHIVTYGNSSGVLVVDQPTITTTQTIILSGTLNVTGTSSEASTNLTSANIASTFTYQGLSITFPIAGTTAILSNNNTWTGTNSFTGALVSTGTVSLATPLPIAYGGTARTSFPILPTTQTFTTGSSANYVTPATNPSPFYLVVEMCGGGGGGGAQATNAGSVGTSTSFGGWTAGVGQGGPNGGATTVGGAGGTGGGNGTGSQIVRTPGGRGEPSVTGGNANPTIGGISFFGGTGTTSNAAQPNGCGGGSGGGLLGTAYGGGGGSGEYVRFQIPIAAANTAFIYTVGASGAGGVAGTTAGQASGGGIIIVREYYQ